MTKIAFDPKLYALPTTQLILGTHINGRPNFMALAWATRVNFKPPLVAIGVNRGNNSHQAILDHAQFSLCMPPVDLVEITDYTGLVSSKKTDKSKLFEVFYGQLDRAPLIRQCPLNLELKLYERLDLPTNTVFIGEITGAWCEERCMTDDKPDITAIRPFILTMPDNQFWSIGDKVGNAWNAGKVYKAKSPSA